MKAIVLAAGQGTRLRPLTDHRPKCMVPYKGKPLLHWQLETLAAHKLDDVIIVAGYRHDAIGAPGAKILLNPDFETTNMVSSLFCAEAELQGDIIVSYGDIIYRPEVLASLLASQHEFSVVVDRSWRKLWEQRMADPLKDAETMKLTPDGRILELGRKPGSYTEIQGQYIGLFKISNKVIERVKEHYHSLDREEHYEGRSFDNMFMTTFIQSVIDELLPVHAVFIDGGWLEVDEPGDLQLEMHVPNEA